MPEQSIETSTEPREQTVALSQNRRADNRERGIIKRLLVWVVLMLFLLACGIAFPSGGGANNPITIDLASAVTPLPTPPPIRLSPITATNVDRIQDISTWHVSDTVRVDDLLAISPDKKWVALTPRDDNPLHIQRLSWPANDSFVPMGAGFSSFYLYLTTSVAFSPDSMHVAVANEADNSVLIFGLEDLPNSTKPQILPIGDRPVAVTFTGDSQKLIIAAPGAANGSLQLWDVGTGAFEREIPGAPGAVCSVALSPDDKLLAAGSCMEPFTISTWDIDAGYRPLTQLTKSDQAGPCGAYACPGQRNVFAFNPITGEIATGLDFPVISVHDPRTGKLSTSVTASPARDSSSGGESIGTLAYTSDGTILVMLANQELQLVDAKGGNLLWHLQDPRPTTAVAISADSRLMVSLTGGGDIILFGVPTR